MAGEEKEPQSYGSQQDWTTGRTGQEVNPPKAVPPPEHAAFYDSRRESEENAPAQGGFASTAGSDESVQHFGRTEGSDAPSSERITGAATGAKRDSSFRKRDYE